MERYEMLGGEAARRFFPAPPEKGACFKAFCQANGKAAWPSKVLTFTGALMRIVWLRSISRLWYLKSRFLQSD
jgi:hypothetical protein